LKHRFKEFIVVSDEYINLNNSSNLYLLRQYLLKLRLFVEPHPVRSLSPRIVVVILKSD
jgi:hypothetical protein